MLVIMENWDIEELLQALFDFKAAGSGNILKIHAAKSRCYPDDSLDNLFNIGGVEADRHRVHATEILKK
ncbi:unannotated protein [freshwater metagenome]|uniref:Unannotated protein n=1 Tax=freshwater metagenome TaxID=449393 RepID=A0A6J7Q7W6_9ZZZZ